MKFMPVTDPTDKRILQLIDANLDRAKEGLRVLEDWCRYSQDNKELIIKLKEWRQSLGAHHKEIYHQARSTNEDQGIGISHPAQENRDLRQILNANASRAQEALRVLEEFSRDIDPSLAKESTGIRYGLYQLQIDLLKRSDQAIKAKKLESCSLYLITNDKSNLKEKVLMSLQSGLRLVQYRCKEGNDSKRITQASEIASLCRKFNALFILNDRVDIALAIGADGVHLGQQDMPISIARKLLGEDKIIGKSTHSLEQIQKAQEEGCDYIGIGPVFKTDTKPAAIPAGVNYLAEACKHTSLPCFAIGGINNLNIEEVTSAGIKRVAVCGAIMNSSHPEQETKMLLNLLQCN